MKFLLSISLVLCVVSCETHVVQVLDSKTRVPVAGASVRARSGDVSSITYVTDNCGLAIEPTVPGGASELVVTKDGYTTKSIKLR